MTHPALARAEAFAATYGLRRPVLLAPMAGACPPALSLAVMRAGGLGACGALPMQPPAILAWAEAVREAGPFQINLWIPDPAPVRDPAHEARLRAFLGGFGPAVAPEAGDAMPPDFFAQCEAVIQARPRIVSSIMGLYPPDLVARFKASGIAWWATVTTVAEALAAEAAGADAVVAQGAEAGGHRGSFDPARAEMAAVGLMALLPAVVDAVTIPVVATGGIADARGAAAALLLGEIEDRIAFLRSLRVPPPGRLAGTWSNLFGTVTVTPGTDGGLAVKVDANEPITARWTCGAEGKGRLAGDVLTVSLGEDGSALTLAREGETLTLGAVPGKGEAEGTADYCGLNGSVDGTYFFVTPAAPAR
ncbi:NAD(P)H-dependent flavin oxidoreductase [Methylobacterium indicum]|uniref:NAD(P)H-dependent flavin oxidoreductase n=1 Tax=Methylobacterium indicum TaxID=1775910 RepID=UPI000AC8B2DD|nr:nitronate monooxygenase [Methylobacterium indicum]